MKIIVVYYTRTRTTEKMANYLASKLEADIEEILDLKNRQGMIGWIKAGRDAMRESLTEIEEAKHNPADYDLVVVGTPVWAGTVTPAVRTYLVKNKDKFKRIAFFTTQGSDKRQRVFAAMEEISDKKPEAELFCTTKEVANDNYQIKLKSFIKKLKYLYV